MVELKLFLGIGTIGGIFAGCQPVLTTSLEYPFLVSNGNSLMSAPEKGQEKISPMAQTVSVSSEMKTASLTLLVE